MPELDQDQQPVQTPPSSTVAPVRRYKTPAEAIENDAHGEEFLQTLPVPIQQQVRAFAEGRRAFPSGIAMSKPEMQQMLNIVGQYDPSFDQTDFNMRNRTRIGFTSGRQGDQANNLNTAIEHLENLSTLGDQLHNRQWPLWNWAANKVSEWTGNAAVPTFKANRGLVAEELTKAYRGSGGAEADIARAIKDYDENMSPEQLNGVIGTVAGLLQSKADQLQQQYSDGMGSANKGYRVVTGAHQSVLDNLKARATGQGVPVSSATPAPATPQRPSSIPAGADAQYSPSRQQWRYSIDGGKTWQTLQAQPPAPPQQ